MLTRKEEKLICKYCILPTFALPAFRMCFVSAPVAIVLLAIDGAFLHNFTDPLVIGAEIVLPMVFYMGVHIYAQFSYAFGTRSKRWEALVREIAVRSGFPGYIAEKYDDTTGQYGPEEQMTFEESIPLLMRNPEGVAALANVQVPSGKNLKRFILIMPIVLQIVCFIPQFISSAQAMDERREHATMVLEQLDAAFVPGCEKVIWDNPREMYQKSGYAFRAYLPETDGCERIYLWVTVEEDGQIDSIAYYCDVNVERTKDENLALAQQSFEKLHGMLIDSGVTGSTGAVTQIYEMPEELETAFRNGSYYEPIDCNDLWSDGECAARVYWSYETHPQEDYRESDSARFHLLICKSLKRVN